MHKKLTKHQMLRAVVACVPEMFTVSPTVWGAPHCVITPMRQTWYLSSFVDLYIWISWHVHISQNSERISDCNKKERKKNPHKIKVDAVFALTLSPPLFVHVPKIEVLSIISRVCRNRRTHPHPAPNPNAPKLCPPPPSKPPPLPRMQLREDSAVGV